MTSPVNELVRDAEWQRLDPRMLLVYPLRELLRFLPALIGLVVAGSASGGMQVRWQLLGIGIPVALGLLRYVTTSFRVADGPGRAASAGWSAGTCSRRRSSGCAPSSSPPRCSIGCSA